MEYTITKVEPYLADGTQCLSLTADRLYKPFEVTHEGLYKALIPIQCKEFELLVGCILDIDYYEKGEKMKNGRTSGSYGYHMKSISLKLPKTLDEMRIEDGSKTLSFGIIYDTYIFSRKNRIVVCIRTITGCVYFMNLPDFERVTTLSKENFGLLTGSFLSPVYYEKDEVSESGWIVSKGGTIVKELNLRTHFSFTENFALNGRQSLLNPPRRSTGSGYQEYRPSYSKYNGHGGYDDQTIDNAFEGDITATWGYD